MTAERYQRLPVKGTPLLAGLLSYRLRVTSRTFVEPSVMPDGGLLAYNFFSDLYFRIASTPAWKASMFSFSVPLGTRARIAELIAS